MVKSDIDLKEISRLLEEGEIRKIRTIWYGRRQFDFLYKWLFDEGIMLAKEQQRPTFAKIVADYMYRDNLVVDREINASACCVSLMVLMEREVKF
jgi:hypothetical protein